MSRNCPSANISARTVPYAVPTTSGGTTAVTSVQKKSPSSTRISRMDSGSIFAMSLLAPSSVSYAMGTDPVRYVLTSSPDAFTASETASLMFPTSSIADRPPPTSKLRIRTPLSEPSLLNEPITSYVTSPSKRSPRESSNAPEPRSPDCTADSSSASSYGITSTVSVPIEPSK